MMGIGTVTFTDQSTLLINTNGILGVESLNETLPNNTVCTIPTTRVNFNILESAHVNIGQGNTIWGGVFQVGDTVATSGNAVNFTLTLNGADAQFNLGTGGFFGLGAGVVRPNQGPNDNQTNVLADTLFDVNQITLNFFAGEFDHNRIFTSDDPRSASMVLGSFTSMTINYDVIDDIAELNAADFLTSGGGNLFLLVPGSVPGANLGAMRLFLPTGASDNIINAPFGATTVQLVRMRDGLLASTELHSDATPVIGGPLPIFTAIKTGDSTAVVNPSYTLSNVAPLDTQRFRQERTLGVLGYVDRGIIGRQDFINIIDTNGGTNGEQRSRAYDIGAVFVQIDTTQPAPGPVLTSNQILSE
jgi:hypothetical protein